MENLETKPTIETEKGRTYKKFADFYAAYKEVGLSPIVRIHGKKVENGILVDDFSQFVDAVAHKINEHSANMNVYDGRELIAYFRLKDDNISQFRIEIIKK